jgi:integrase
MWVNMKVDLIELWLTTVGATGSNSKHTKDGYKLDFERYLAFFNITPEEILEEYNQNDIIQGNQIIRIKEQVIQRHTQAIKLFKAKLINEGYLPGSWQKAVYAIRSFYKHNNLPLGNIEMGRQRVILHNRDITKGEIEEIIRVAQPREKAFYSLLVQSGLRPQTLCLLKIGEIDGLISENTKIPALIKVSEEQTKGQYGSYWTFAGKESIDYLKEYLKRRNQPLNPDEYLFTHDKENNPINTDLISHIFRRSVEKLKKEGVMDFKNKETAKANRNEIRLYNLRKYFRNNAGSGGDFVNFWMGHVAQLGVDGHYFSKEENKENIEKHRQKYADTALKNLRIDAKTPNQMEQSIIDLQSQVESLQFQLKSILARRTPKKPDDDELDEDDLVEDVAEPTAEEMAKMQDDLDAPEPSEDEPMSEEESLREYNDYLRVRIDELEASNAHFASELDEIKKMLKEALKK